MTIQEEVAEHGISMRPRCAADVEDASAVGQGATWVDERVAGVRCCAGSTASGNFTAASICNERCERVPFAEAESRCATADMRLCTEEEVLSGSTCCLRGV